MNEMAKERKLKAEMTREAAREEKAAEGAQARAAMRLLEMDAEVWQEAAALARRAAEACSRMEVAATNARCKVAEGDNWTALQRTSRPLETRNAMERAREALGEAWREACRKTQAKAMRRMKAEG